ncbi:cation:dicarboxylate symporter family transporter [Thalassotalea euphylliae]|uniref:cation:dicarboxylate symporter family transporter n=1 Tax=Thalassotalea euphylliae TaxID=1655234 RepID=UPI00363DB2A8
MLNKIPLSVKILIGMLLGLAAGHYVAQPYQAINSVADGFVMLLQMTALPYICLSLITGIGSLTPGKAKSTVKASIILVLILTLVSVTFILMTPISFPDWKNASFYSASTIKTEAEFDLVKLFIPANPFNAFANAVIPSVVVFSVFVGVGLMTVRGKRHTLAVLTNLQSAIGNISGIVMKLAPIGVFCIGYRALATLDMSQLEALSVYIVASAVLTILLAFVVFPTIVATITPFRYRSVIKVCREAMITAFATGSFFAVIPIIIEKTKALIAERIHIDKDSDKVANILVPITFSLPVGGKLLGLVFTLFAAWFSGAYIGNNEYFKLIFVGIPQLFGTTTIAVPALLDLFNVASNMFDLFLVAENLVVGRLSSLLSVSFASCFVLLVVSHISGRIVFKTNYVIRNLLVLPIVFASVFFGVQHGFNKLSLQYKGYEKFIDRDLLYERVNATKLEKPNANGQTQQPFTDVLTRIKRRGFLRVGYFIDDLPYSFQNKEGNLVGLDIEIINMLAGDLEVDIEFVKILHEQAEPLLSSGYLDMTSGIPVIPDNMKRFSMTVPYSEQSIAFLVKHRRRAEFTDWQKVVAREDLIIGIPETLFYRDEVERVFVNGKAWEISTPRLFFRENYQHIDAMLFGAAALSGWSLLYPEYTVVVPKPALKPIYMAFPINKNDLAFELFMRNWIDMKKQSGRLDELFRYWIEGQSPESAIRVNIE